VPVDTIETLPLTAAEAEGTQATAVSTSTAARAPPAFTTMDRLALDRLDTFSFIGFLVLDPMSCSIPLIWLPLAAIA